MAKKENKNMFTWKRNKKGNTYGSNESPYKGKNPMRFRSIMARLDNQMKIAELNRKKTKGAN